MTQRRAFPALTALALFVGACALLEKDRAGDGAGHGPALYARHCAACHGRDGGGDGPAAPYLFPAPRSFRSGVFHLVSTQNGNPSDTDLLRVIEEGMPGSAMPGWGWLSAADRRGLAAHVRELALDGRADELIADAWREEVELDVATAEALAADELRPGAPVAAGDPPPMTKGTDAFLARGRTLYLERCASCHGEDGRGDGSGPTWNDDGTPNRPRDFTGGLLRGGLEPARLVERILAGIPGTAMAATRFDDPDDAWAVAAHVRSLVQVEGAERARQVRRSLVASAGTVSASLDDAAWGAAERVTLPLMPLVWHSEPVATVDVRAIHDGSRLALLLEWEDATADDDPLSSLGPDGLALMLSDRADPPVFAMGGSASPVAIWQWKSFWAADAMGIVDLVEAAPLPHTFDPLAGESATDATPFRFYDGSSDSPVRAFRAAGPGLLRAPVETGGDVDVQAERTASGWRLLLAMPGPTDAASVRFALAVWDGATGDRGARKSITIWHELALR